MLIAIAIAMLALLIWAFKHAGPAADDVVGSYWPRGLDVGPLRLTDIEDASVDLERDIAWPVDRLAVN
jgi:hypothetical protein